MVELREITKENYEECLNLNIAKSQKDFVSSTAHSLAQAWVYYDTAFPFAIYADNTMVGFIMLGYYETEGYYTIIMQSSDTCRRLHTLQRSECRIMRRDARAKNVA